MFLTKKKYDDKDCYASHVKCLSLKASRAAASFTSVDLWALKVC